MLKKIFYFSSGMLGFAVSFGLMMFLDEKFQSELLAGILMLAVAAVSIFLIFRSGYLDKKEDTLPGIFSATFGTASIFLAFTEFATAIENSALNLKGAETIIAIGLSIVVGACFRYHFIKKMKNVAHATEAANYLNKKSVNIIKRKDIFVVYEKWWGGVLEKTSNDINEGNF